MSMQKRSHVITLDCFLKPPKNIETRKEYVPKVYAGNTLDSSLPVRNSGKHREISKKRNKSKLKEDILKHELEQPLELMLYLDNVVTDELNMATTIFLKKIVAFQEQAFKKNPEKARNKRRYVLGIHETKKYMAIKKIKFLIIASDVRVRDPEELLYKSILDLQESAKENNISYVFALKRSKIGNITNKYRPITCVGVLNFQSAEDELTCVVNNIIKPNEESISEENKSEYEKLLQIFKETILGSKVVNGDDT